MKLIGMLDSPYVRRVALSLRLLDVYVASAEGGHPSRSILFTVFMAIIQRY